jgi:hypothetical protein
MGQSPDDVTDAEPPQRRDFRLRHVVVAVTMAVMLRLPTVG